VSPAPGRGVTFTVMLPVHRPPVLLPYAIESVLAQRRKDFELIIICDGTPDETVEHARAAAARDPRIQVRAYPKGERFGEAYRHEVLGQARGTLVCQIADDDLWLPNHLDEMAKLLEEFEFGNVPQIEVEANGIINVPLEDLAQPQIRERMMNERVNFFGPSVAGYRLATYRRLPVGWSPAPAGIWSDLYMWRKFLALPDIVCGTRFGFTNLHFHASNRTDWTLERREAETKAWAKRARDPRACDRLFQAFLRHLAMQVQEAQQEKRARRRVASSKA
jgi:glycosyltransferase involved in cell wall biosynthesis